MRNLENIESIAIIGAGKIGSAIIKALRSCSNIKIIATGRRNETLRYAERLGAIATRDNDRAVREAEIVVLSVKPNHFPIVVKQVNRESWKDKTVVSIMAGIRIKTLKDALGKDVEIYRAMPNINALVRKAATAISTLDEFGEYRKVVEELFKCLGTVFWVPEEYLDIWTGLVGSGPAFIAEIVDALVLGAVASGMPRDLAYQGILDVLEGTSTLLKNIRVHPAEVRDEVTTPGGTTIRGLMVMESEGVKSALMKTVEETYKRSREIGLEIDSRIRKELGLQ